MDRELSLASEDGDMNALNGVTSHGATRENSYIMDRELFLASEVRDIDKIQTLHEQDKDVLDGVTFQGDTALHIAAREGHQDIVKWILKEKPSLAKARNKDDNTALHEAAKSGNTEVVRLLLQLNQSSNYRHNKFRETALVIASQYGHVGAVELLLQARPSEDPFEWHRSVREAALRGYKDVVVAMLANTPRCNFTSLLMRLLADAWYKDVLVAMLAKTPRCNFTLLLRLLQAWYWGFPKTPILHAAVLGGDLEVIEAMLNHDSWESNFMTVEDEYGRCAIHVAAIKGHSHIINKFMSRTPDSVNIRSSDGKSVLHFAVEYNQLNVVKCLLANKEAKKVAKLVSHDRDESGNTALHFAASNGASVELLDGLLSHQSGDVNAVNHEGITALDIASAGAKDNPNWAIIEQKLEEAGGVRLSVMSKYSTKSDSSGIIDPRNANVSKEVGDKDILNTQIVVASLIATVTFAAIFQIPGGIEDDDKESVHYGVAKMAFHKLFKFFILCDIAACITSLAVVVVWLLRSVLRDTSFGVTVALSLNSVWTLIASIFWTAAAFVSATMIVTVPSNYENLKSTHKKAYSQYFQLLKGELFIPIFSAFYVCLSFLHLVVAVPGHIGFAKIYKWIHLSVITFFILKFTFSK